MKLVGLLDSPFVRRTFITARLLGIPLAHQPLSVFRNVPEFSAINPLLKAPTLVLDDGSVMVDSSLIIDWLERVAEPGHSLMPADADACRRCLQFVGWGLAAAEKSVQRFYETRVRPEPLRYPEWIERASGQIRESYAMIDKAAGDADWLCGAGPTQADITVAVAWRFTRFTAPGLVDDGDYPRVAALSARAEALPAFQAADFG